MATHAGISHAIKWGDSILDWEEDSNSLVVLTVADEAELLLFRDLLYNDESRFTEFFEPDIGNQLTAVAVFPGEIGLAYLKKLPLCLKDTSDPRWQKEFALREEVRSNDITVQ